MRILVSEIQVAVDSVVHGVEAFVVLVFAGHAIEYENDDEVMFGVYIGC